MRAIDLAEPGIGLTARLVTSIVRVA